MLVTPFIHQPRFLKALEYVSEHFFSKPYSISPMVSRWFNQLAMIELENGKVIHLTGDLAKNHVDVILNGAVVPKEKVALVYKFHAQNAEFEKERTAINGHIKGLRKALLTAQSLNKKEIAEQLWQQEQSLIVFNNEQLHAKKLFEQLTDKNAVVFSQLNEQSLAQQFKSKIKNIIYRPNHGIAHSARVAYLTTSIHAFKKAHNKASLLLTDPELEKIQMMMLFSVVGRRDETGFNDGPEGRQTYQGFRATSGKEFLNYAQEHLKALYGTDRKSLYRDALIVELMGYRTIDHAANTPLFIPEVFIDYVLELERASRPHTNREEALDLIIRAKYNLKDLFKPATILQLSNDKLAMMNDAHGIDLTRCYSLYAQKEGGSKSITVINRYLQASGFYNMSGGHVEQLTSVFQILRASFDALELTGQNSTFGLISAQTFAAEKEHMVNAVKEINKRFATPIASEQKKLLLAEEEKIHKEMNSYWNNIPQESTLEYYRKFLILKETTTRLTAAAKLNPHQRMFQFQHSKNGAIHDIDHQQNAVRLVNALHTINPVAGISPQQLPLISAVRHNKEYNKVTLYFDTQANALEFQNTYEVLFAAASAITDKNTGHYSIEVNREQYQQLVNNKQVEFKPVSIPKHVSGEEDLVDKIGNLNVLNLINHSRALIRSVSTTALRGEDFPDYDYLLNALEDPVHNRYVAPLKELTHFRENATKYYDPRNGESYNRKHATMPALEVRFQEPVTASKNFSDKLSQGLVRQASRGSEKNTIFTKKLAHSLLPPHGKLLPFAGYAHLQNNYFPIGLISNIDQVDLKSERYIWAQNMGTASKFWLRDASTFNKGFYKLLNASFDAQEGLTRSNTGMVLLDKAKLKNYTPQLVSYLKSRAERIVTKLNEKYYRPTNEVLADFKVLLQQERDEYLRQSTDAKERKDINAIYTALLERVAEEKARKHPKYAITIRELIDLQKKNNTVEQHNELLVANTKAATKALYVHHDQLFNRLNLALHALHIKKRFGYDLPLVVLSAEKSPYHYSEHLVKADLQEAIALIKKGTFPFDTSHSPVYELDEKGEIKIEQGLRVRKKDDKGEYVTAPKNLTYQQSLLVDLFKLGMPNVTNYTQLISELNDTTELNTAIDSIISQMNLVGGLARERTRMHQLLVEKNPSKINDFFLRSISLGHQSLIDELIANNALTLSDELLKKASNQARRYSESTCPLSVTDSSKKNSLDEKEFIGGKDRVLSNTENNSLIEQCSTLLKKIEAQSLGELDSETKDFCYMMQNILDKNHDDELALSMALKKIQLTYAAVTSSEMQAIQSQIRRLEMNAQSFFSIGNRNKIHKIKEAMSQVPLLERMHIFSNEENPCCNKVRIALATHRISFANPIDKHHKVINTKAAKSFTTVEQELKNHHTVQKDQLKEDRQNTNTFK